MKRVPFMIIQAAKTFDTEAVMFVLNHFKGYIAYRSLSACVDEYGNVHMYPDEDLCYEAEKALFDAINGFRFQYPPDSMIV